VNERPSDLDNPSPAFFPLRLLEGGLTVVRVAPLEGALPGALAAFSTRLGGVSKPPWGAMNVGYHVGDSPVDVTENRRRLFRALGLRADTLVTAGQVHSDVVALVSAPGHQERTDGLATLSGGLTLAVFCADCVPVWLLDPKTPAAAVVHAGWKGSLAGIAGRAARLMIERLGCRPKNLLAAIGPSIGPCCYEVGPDVAGPAADLYGPDVLSAPGPGGKARLDLWEINRRALTRAGLDPWRVYVSGLCTSCREDLFHSHRREALRSAGSDGTPDRAGSDGMPDRAGLGGAPDRAGRMVALLRLPEGK